MSVINNVLKDLEARETSFTPIEITAAQAPSTAPRKFNRMLFASGLLITAAAAFYLLLTVPDAAIPDAATVSAGDSGAAMPVIEVAALADRSHGSMPVTASQTPAPTAETEPAAAVETSPSAPTAANRSKALAPSTPISAMLPAIDEAAAEPAPAAGIDSAPGNQIVGLQLRESEQEMQMEFVLRDRVVAYLRERGENHFAYRLREIESQIVAPQIHDNRWIRTLSINAAGDGVDIDFETASDILVEARQSVVDGETVWVISLRQAAAPEPPVAAANEPASAPVPMAQDALAAAADADSSGAATPLENEPVRLEITATNPNAKNVSRLEYAVELINSRRLAEAETLLRELLGGTKDYPARQRLIVLYQRDRRPGRALQMAQESWQKYPQDTLFKTEYARAMFQQNAYRDVIALFAGAPGLDAAQQALVAASYQRLDEHADAVRHYRLALAQDAGNARNWIGLGISQEHTAALEDALNSYQQAGRLGVLNERLQAFVIRRSDTLRQVLN